MPCESEPFRVRYAETDAQGVAYYGSYFTWWEVGEVALLEELGLSPPDLEAQGLLLTAAESYARFLRPAVYDDWVLVRIRLSEVAPKRVRFDTELVRVDDGTVLATGKMADVVVGRSGEVLPIPEPFRGLAEQRVERIVLSREADELFAGPPPGAHAVTDDLMVRYAETDAQRVAYYGSYYTWYEVGRNELTRSVGLPYSQLERQGIFLPVSEAFCRHLSPLRACERFRLATWVPRFTRARITFVNHIMSADGRPVASGYTVHGCTGRDGRPRGLPAEVTDRFALCEETQP
jgi:acyl-CoA thioester hydrolase